LVRSPVQCFELRIPMLTYPLFFSFLFEDQFLSRVASLDLTGRVLFFPFPPRATLPQFWSRCHLTKRGEVLRAADPPFLSELALDQHPPPDFSFCFSLVPDDSHLLPAPLGSTVRLPRIPFPVPSPSLSPTIFSAIFLFWSL